MRRGRDTFHIFYPVMRLVVAILKVLPSGVAHGLLVITRHVPTTVGLGFRYVSISRVARSCGSVVAVFEGVYLRVPQQLVLGDHVSIHPMCYLDATGGIQIGSDVSIAHGVTIMTTEHIYTDDQAAIRDVPVQSSPVTIGNDVWIGAGVKILAGVEIGDRVVVGAGAVVTRDIPSNSLALGVPARVVKDLGGAR